MKKECRAKLVVSFSLGRSLCWASLVGSIVSSAAIATDASDRQVNFDIPAQSVESALIQFSQQANMQVMLRSAAVAGRSTSGVKGRLNPASALSHLLQDTNLTYEAVGSTVTVRLATAAEPKATEAEGPVQRTPLSPPDKPGPSRSLEESSPPSPSHPKNKVPPLEEVVVTGSHLPGVPPASPVITIDHREILRSGYTATADIIRSLPQNFSGGVNPQTSIGNSPTNGSSDNNPGGATSPNLRGLGPASTLVLINGRRLAHGLPGGGTDVSSIPIPLIDKIEVVVDSASAVYGSDAVAGVVNVILKDDYDGAHSGVSFGSATQGGGTEKRANQLLGRTWDSGNALVAYEFSEQAAVDASDRTFTASAARPSSLLPRFSNNSFSLTAEQKLTSRISVFADGFYASKHNIGMAADPGALFSIERNGALTQRSAVAGLDISLPGEWRGSIFATDAENKTRSFSYRHPLDSSPMLEFSKQFFRGKMHSIEAIANGRIGQLPAGTVHLALGGGHRQESFSDNFVFVASNRAVPVSNGEREIDYLFTELSVPVLADRLDLTASARYENYSDFGTKTVPKFGLVYRPIRDVQLRGTWGKAFRAPNISDMNASQAVLLSSLPDPNSATGTSTVLLHTGANPDLQPETAESWSLGVDYSPGQFDSLQVSATYFDIDYSDRVASISNLVGALTDPVNAFYLARSPSEVDQQSLIASVGGQSRFFNLTGAPYSPGNVTAIVDTRNKNVARQRARGVDLLTRYTVDFDGSQADFFVNATYLDLAQRNEPLSAERRLSGSAFYPSRIRARAGATWKNSPMEVTGIINYLDGETNIFLPSRPLVASWTTVDASISYAPRLSGLLEGIRLTIAVQNILDKDPPYLQYDARHIGFNYDSLNATPIGRFMSVQLSKEW